MRVLITGDDGPPSKSSPYVLGLYQMIKERLGWDISVVLPSAQKSWGGLAFSVHQPVSVWYYYPLADNVDGSHRRADECWSPVRRPIDTAKGEIGEWILLDASPATCANAGLFNQRHLFPDTSSEDGYRSEDSAASSSSSGKRSGSRGRPPPFDLVISGPNYGRNTGTSFALGSGTVGAALAASLAKVRAISLSYGHFAITPEKFKDAERKYGPRARRDSIDTAATQEDTTEAGAAPQTKTPPRQTGPLMHYDAPRALVQTAHELAVKIVKRLWDEWEADVGVYTVNVPIAWTIKEPRVIWTTMWRGQHGRLYAPERKQGDGSAQPEKQRLPAGTSDLSTTKDHPPHVPSSAPPPEARLHFAPDMQAMLAPKEPAEGTDIWALMNGWISVTRLRPAFAEVLTPSDSHGAEAQGERAVGKPWRL